MAAEYRLSVALAGYWHAGTGMAAGAGVDAVVGRDRDGLPFLPGSHLRGLMRHALRQYEDLGHWPWETGGSLVDALFGRGDPGASRDPVKSSFEADPGRLSVGDARLPADLRAALAHPARQALRAELFPTLQSTALAEDGVVQARTLRSIEVAVPMTLVAPIFADRPLSATELAALGAALGLVRRVGKHRTRGLGRARLSLEAVA